MNNNNKAFPDKFERALDAITSMTRLDTPGSGKSTISAKHTPLSTRPMRGGQQSLYRFPNGYGASVVNHGIAYGGLELAVIRFDGNGNDYRVVYDTPVTSDVIGHLTPEELEQTLDAINALPVSHP